MNSFEKVAEKYQEIQINACKILENCDSKGRFSDDRWTKDIGSGVTKVMQHGEKIEKGAINFSKVSGNFTPTMAQALGKNGNRYSATGVSSIFHPKNPFAPIIHMNVRYFEIDTGECWFGGGIDLTPHYVDVHEASMFHRELKAVCDNYEINSYQDFKNQADDYFFLKHRNETRGVGGIFFDHLMPENEDGFASLFDFTVKLGELYPKIYADILQNKFNKPFSDEELKWQSIRRSRYVEFNLVYDRGTKFGLESNGNAESILVSMPPNANWEYNYSPEENSLEEKTMKYLKKGINWLTN